MSTITTLLYLNYAFLKNDVKMCAYDKIFQYKNFIRSP